jgi:hypothetical protein
MKNAFPPDLNDKTEYRPMFRWFSPFGLLKTLERVIPSTIFEKYADGRLIHAALDAIAPDTIIETCCGGAKGILGERGEGPFWIDYVADLGDGFNSTYAIAYMVGQEQLQVEGESLPRADCLVMGGDEVYPDANREDYHKRMERPYKAAFPISEREGSAHPPVYLIPGNHDWYDGLALFTSLFCSGHDNTLGSWHTPQRRSYFAIHLGNDWWIWGFDSQLDEDVDGPQSDYFDAVAKSMAPSAKVILCASVPTWLKARMERTEDTKRFERGVHFIASKLNKHRPDAKIPLVIAGDTHHYNRYVANESGTNFITAGGGGAFLHPTHHTLEPSFEFKWLGGKPTTLSMGVDGNSTDRKKESVYPTQRVSRELALGNIWFAITNWDFSIFIGVLYCLCALLMLWWRGYGETGGAGALISRFWGQVNNLWTTPIFLLIFIGFLLALVSSADKKSRVLKWFIAPLHSVSHVALLLFWTSLWSVMLSSWGIRSMTIFGDIFYFLFLVVGMVASGFLGGTLWGLYLTAASFFWGAESNSAFSAMRLESYKHFIRLKIEGNKLTVYPIAVDKCPTRRDWQFNPKCEDGNQNTPVIIPRETPENIGQHFIEKPIEIDLAKVIVKPPQAAVLSSK